MSWRPYQVSLLNGIRELSIPSTNNNSGSNNRTTPPTRTAGTRHTGSETSKIEDHMWYYINVLGG